MTVCSLSSVSSREFSLAATLYLAIGPAIKLPFHLIRTGEARVPLLFDSERLQLCGAVFAELPIHWTELATLTTQTPMTRSWGLDDPHPDDHNNRIKIKPRRIRES